MILGLPVDSGGHKLGHEHFHQRKRFDSQSKFSLDYDIIVRSRIAQNCPNSFGARSVSASTLGDTPALRNVWRRRAICDFLKNAR